jgi:MFS family permease
MFGFEGENAREKVIVLFTMCFALAMAMLDNTVVNVALPTISRELGAGVSELQWIVDGYVLVFASLLLTGGIAGDRYGRKKIFLAGLAIFTLASALCGLSQSTTQLIAARAFQGVGAALLMPGTLSIITVTFPPHERAKAIGLWAGMSGLALALGPTVGGLMVEHLGWESVFFLNVPIGIVAMFAASRNVRESVSEVTRELDIPGLLLGSGALFCATYALIEANEKGWSDPLIVSTLVASAALAVAFLLFERQSPKAMLPLRFFRIPAFSAGATVAFSISFGMFATFFFMSMTVMIIIVAPNAGRYASKHGSRIPMTFGLILAGTGLLLLSRISIDTPYLLLAPVFVMMGIGIGATMAPMTAAVMNAVGPERAGLGSATTNTAREVGGVFGIALLGTILTTRLNAVFAPALSGLGLAPTTQSAIEATAGHGTLDPSQLSGLPPEQQGAVVAAFRESWMSGFRVSLVVAGLVLLVAAVVANRFIPGRAHAREVTAAARVDESAPLELA